MDNPPITLTNHHQFDLQRLANKIIGGKQHQQIYSADLSLIEINKALLKRVEYFKTQGIEEKIATTKAFNEFRECKKIYAAQEGEVVALCGNCKKQILWGGNFVFTMDEYWHWDCYRGHRK